MTSLEGLPKEFLNFFDVFDPLISRSEPVMVVNVKSYADGVRELERGFIL
jgi:hypothetical protein